MTTGPCHLLHPSLHFFHPNAPLGPNEADRPLAAPPVTSQCKGHTVWTLTEGA